MAVVPSPVTAVTNFPGDHLPPRLLSSDSMYPWNDLTIAYSLWYALPASDPRGPCYQRNLHNQACFGLRVHDDWRFLFWHRAFLYFHERILTDLLRKNQRNFTGVFRLPVWNWDEKHYIPDGYLNVPGKFPSLHPCSCLTALGCGSEDELSAANLSFWLKTDGSKNFLGTKSIRPTASDGFHEKVHVLEGYLPVAHGDIGLLDDLRIAAYDPLFYGHHANVDRFFEAWKRLYLPFWNAFKTKPPNTSFNFIDFDKSTRSVTVSQLLFDESYALPQYLSRVSDSTGPPLKLRSNQRYGISIPTGKLATQPGHYLLRYRLQGNSVDVGRFSVMAGDSMPGMSNGPVSSFLVSPQVALSIGRLDPNVPRFEVIPLRSSARPFPLRLGRRDFGVELLVFSPPVALESR